MAINRDDASTVLIGSAFWRGDALLADVDHFFPHVLKADMAGAHLDGAWNLLLVCKDCIQGHDSKSVKLPKIQLSTRLHTRNVVLIGGHYPF